jgi:hypothetical protein
MFKKTDISIRCSYKHKFRVPNDERSHGATSHSTDLLQTARLPPTLQNPPRRYNKERQGQNKKICRIKKAISRRLLPRRQNSPFRSIIRVRPSFEMNASPKAYPAAYQGQQSTETSTHSISINFVQALRHANPVS